MKRQKATKKTESTEPIRVDSAILAKVKEYKKESGVAINRFYDLAAKEKLERIGIVLQ